MSAWRRVWRAAAKGRDVLAVAQPGSGKTLAYLLAMAARLMGAPSTGASAADLAPAPRGLVLLPTRCATPCLQPCMPWHHRALSLAWSRAAAAPVYLPGPLWAWYACWPGVAATAALICIALRLVSLAAAFCRELAQQVAGVARGLRGVTRMRTVCVHGGAARAPQQKALQAQPMLLVATPGRLLDLLDSGALALGTVPPPVHGAVRDPVRVVDHSNGLLSSRKAGLPVVSA